jgi:hypothetical protein
MADAGFDGEASRRHLAASGDRTRLDRHGTLVHRGPQDALAADTRPCLVQTEAGWWLLSCNYDGADDSRPVLRGCSSLPDTGPR